LKTKIPIPEILTLNYIVGFKTLFMYFVNLPERRYEKHPCYVQLELYIKPFGWDGRKYVQVTMKFS
jgi:hypothetical protein